MELSTTPCKNIIASNKQLFVLEYINKYLHEINHFIMKEIDTINPPPWIRLQTATVNFWKLSKLNKSSIKWIILFGT